jgi:hypothetical protein
MTLILAGCSGVSQEEYDRVVSEQEALLRRVESLENSKPVNETDQKIGNIVSAISEQAKTTFTDELAAEVTYDKNKNAVVMISRWITLKQEYFSKEEYESRFEWREKWDGAKLAYTGLCNDARTFLDNAGLTDISAQFEVRLDNGYTVLSIYNGTITYDETAGGMIVPKIEGSDLIPPDDLVALMQSSIDSSGANGTINVEYVAEEDKFLLISSMSEVTYETFKQNVNTPEMLNIWNAAKDDNVELCSTARTLIDAFDYVDSTVMLEVRVSSGQTVLAIMDGTIIVDVAEDLK